MIRRNIFSFLVALIILYLSLASSQTFNKVSFFNIPHSDKIAHICMYFGLMLVITLENFKSIRGKGQLLVIAFIPLCYGILMEILQLTFTDNRQGSFYDILFNAAGIIVSVLLWPFIKRIMLKLKA